MHFGTRHITGASLGLLLIFAARVSAAPPLLNPSFESATVNTDLTSWTEFGNVFQEPVTPLTGTYSVKLFGNFTSSVNLSGLFQDLAASPGEGWTAGVNVRHNTGDALVGGNRALLKLEFLNGSFAQLAASEITILTASSPLDTYSFHALQGVAPASTAFARITLLFEQDAANSGGAAFFDDASLVPEPAGLALAGLVALGLARRRR